MDFLSRRDYRNIMIAWHSKILNDSNEAQGLRVGLLCSVLSVIVEV